jgi:peptidoglycan/LPS O-acetylase OafA/YrhL
LKYRAEIDGLRALAVVPVILFHAGFELFSGGFVGVDVFFVISGYLITTILIEDLESQRFSLVNFYERRARRILPALFFVMFVCIPFAWMWMYSAQMKDFSQSLVAVSLFASNILFWREFGDYFDTAAEEKPLLHTWSLAVEEQYYVLFPIFLILAWRFGKNRVFWMIVVMAAISLLLSEWGWRNKATANFYLAPTRAWELFAGSITAFIVQKQGVQKNNALALLGLSAIVFSVFFYDETIPFPSVYALVPVLGVVLLVLYADKETLVAKFLSTKVFVGIGLISYSAYLWHQPLFVFARILSEKDPTVLLMGTLSMLSIALAFLSWRFIEKPFRRSEIVSRMHIFLASLIGMSFFLSVGLMGHYKDGYFNYESLNPVVDTSELTNVSLPIYVIGDSHARHLVSGLENLNSGAVVNMSSSGCIPFRNVDRYDFRFEVGACVRTMNAHLDVLKEIGEPSIIILSSMGPVYLDGTTFNGKDKARVTGLGVKLITDYTITNHYEVFEIGMRETLNELGSNPNLTTIFALDIPELGIDNGCQNYGKQLNILGYELQDFLTTNVSVESCVVSRDDYERRTRRYKELVSRVLEEFPGIYVFNPTDYFCTTEVCNGILNDFGYLYEDIDHLSDNGSIYYANSLFNSFNFFIDE